MSTALATPAPTFTSSREHALHFLGTTLPGVANAQEALKHGGLAGWNLRKQQATVNVGGLTLSIPDTFAIIRDRPFHDGEVDVLAAVGPAYKVIQHEQLTGLLDTLAEEAGAIFETAGELEGGRRVFVTMRLPRGAKVGGVDEVDIYLSVFASHDGETSTSLMVTPVRVDSQATLNLAFSKGGNLYKVRHYTGAASALHKQSRLALDFTYDYVDAFQEQAARLAGVKLSQSKFEGIIAKNFGAPAGADKRTVTRAQNKLDKMAELFSDAYALQSVGGTAWAGLAALAEWHDHFSPVRSPEGSTEMETRSRKALLDPSFKNTALKIMLAQG